MSRAEQQISIGPNDDSVRLDRFIRKRLTQYPLSTLFKAIRTGDIRVNGKKAKGESRLRNGDRVSIRILSAKEEPGENEKPIVPQGHPYLRRDPPILFEDASIIVIDKPSGVASQGGGRHTAFNLIDWARAQRPKEDLHMVHRLDAETSGVVVLAKGVIMARKISDAWRSKHVKKTYRAIVWGTTLTSSGTWIDTIARGLGKSSHISEVHPEGARGEMHWSVDERGKSSSLISVDLKSGRHHQIRVQASHHGFPIVGDRLYGDSGRDALARKNCEVVRLLLHAETLTLELPGPNGSQVQTFHAELPGDFSKAWKCLSPQTFPAGPTTKKARS